MTFGLAFLYSRAAGDCRRMIEKSFDEEWHSPGLFNSQQVRSVGNLWWAMVLKFDCYMLHDCYTNKAKGGADARLQGVPMYMNDVCHISHPVDQACHRNEGSPHWLILTLRVEFLIPERRHRRQDSQDEVPPSTSPTLD